MELRFRLHLLLLVIFAGTLAIGIIYVLANVREAVIDELRGSTDVAATLLQGMVAEPHHAAGDAVLGTLVARLDRDPVIRHLRISVTGHGQPGGATLDAARNGRPTAPAWFAALSRPAPAVLERHLLTPQGELLIAPDADDQIDEAWRETKTTLAVLCGVFVGVNVMVFIFLGRALAPLAHMSRALAGIERGDYAARLPTLGLADIDRLSERFNLMAAALARSHADNAALAQRSLAIQEDERRHLAHELHDEMGQSITAIKALAVSIRQRVEVSDPTLAERAATIIDVSSDIYARTRRMMAQLHPVVLDEFGLGAALTTMIDDWNSHHADCFCRYDLPLDLPPLSSVQRIGIYRVVQEALTNIARHAGARAAAVILQVESLAGQQQAIVAEIADDGVGCNFGVPRGGRGIRGMRERVEALGGCFDLSSTIGAGVRIVARVPLARPHLQESSNG